MKEESKAVGILSELKSVDGKYIMPLTKKVEHGQRTVTELTLSEPKAKHIRKMPTNPIMDDVLKICASLASEPDSLIDELSLKDCNRLAEFFGAFS